MKKKLTAPIVITVLVCLWFALYLAAAIWIPGIPTVLKALGILLPLAFEGVAVYNLVERIREIRSGEEDDLDNY